MISYVSYNKEVQIAGNSLLLTDHQDLQEANLNFFA